MNNYTSIPTQVQLSLPGFDVRSTPDYPRRGLMRCLALCMLYNWPHLGALAAYQLVKGGW